MSWPTRRSICGPKRSPSSAGHVSRPRWPPVQAVTGGDAAMRREPLMNHRARRLAAAGMLGCAAWVATAGVADAAPVAQAPYTLTVFARSANGYTAPDSLVLWRDSVLVGFGNGIAKDGTDGKSSTIVQYSLNGAVQRTFSVPGHNDGLRVVNEKDLWCLQNEDANPNLVVIDLESGHQTLYKFAPTVHQGGFDDMVVVGGDVYMTASNPTLVG